ncbi:MAG: hypothetical protein EHM19_13255, partial [Candidatus Latescibacterota bacterium]
MRGESPRVAPGRPRGRARGRLVPGRLSLVFFLLVVLSSSVAIASEGGGDSSHAGSAGERALGEELPLWSVLPFAGILLSIAVFPLVAPHFWHAHYPKVSFAWALLFAVPFLIAFRGEALRHVLEIYVIDYFPFIILLWSLFTAAGGICMTGTVGATPIANAVVLLIGTVLASWVGTTGASMILIRPLLRMNRGRKNKAHIVIFFIFLVSNAGGSLTPLGDPPLFLGYLHGVPFFWTMSLLPMTAVLVALLLGLFVLIDWVHFRREHEFRAALAAAEKIP